MLRPDPVALLAAGLRADTALHLAGRFQELGMGWDEAEAAVRATERPSQATRIALHFWDSWGDAAHHDWLPYPELSADDWPRLAEELVAALDGDAEVDDPLLRAFDLPLRRSYRRRVTQRRAKHLLLAGAFVFVSAMAWGIAHPNDEVHVDGLVIHCIDGEAVEGTDWDRDCEAALHDLDDNLTGAAIGAGMVAAIVGGIGWLLARRHEPAATRV